MQLLGKGGKATPPTGAPVVYFGITQPSSASALRKILTDYLETDIGVNPQIDVLLNSETLLKYFKFITFNERELIFDIDDYADAVSYYCIVL